MLQRIAITLAGCLLSIDALAHSPFPGIKGFYTGLLHPISSPEQVLALLAVGIMLGLRWPGWFKIPFLIFAAATFFGILLGQFDFSRAFVEPMLLLVAVIAATLSALYPPGVFALSVILASITGTMIGLLSTPDSGSLTATIVTLFGSFIGANLALLYISSSIGWFKDRFKGQWSRIGIRIVAAWLAAISVLMASLAFVNR